MPPHSRPPRAAPPSPRRCPDSSLAPAGAVTGPPAHSGTPVNPDSSPRPAAGHPHNPPREHGTCANAPAGHHQAAHPPPRPAPGPAAVRESGRPGKPASAQDPAPRRPRSRCGARFARLRLPAPGSRRAHWKAAPPSREQTGRGTGSGHGRMMSTPKSDEGRTTARHDPVPEVREALPARPGPGCGPWSQVPQPRHPPGHCVPRCAGPHPAVRTRQPGAARAGARTARRGFAPVPKPNAGRHGGGGVLSAQCPHRARPGGIR